MAFRNLLKSIFLSNKRVKQPEHYNRSNIVGMWGIATDNRTLKLQNESGMREDI